MPLYKSGGELQYIGSALLGVAAASVSFLNIPDYRWFLLVGNKVSSDAAAAGRTLIIAFNNDFAGNYYNNSGNTNGWYLFQAALGGAVDNTAQFALFINNTQTQQKMGGGNGMIHRFDTYAAVNQVIYSNVWNNVADKITRIDIQCDVDNLEAGSEFVLYGIK